MAHYLTALGEPVRVIRGDEGRASSTETVEAVKRADIVCAAIPDDKLDVWRRQWSDAIGDSPAVHFSGALSIDGMAGFHPLYSFPTTLLDVAQMRNIAFACPSDGPSFKTIFPSAPNPTFMLHDADRPYYHALAVLSGNLAGFVWNETAAAFKEDFSAAPAEVLRHYFASLVDRFEENPENSFTGPVARKDESTVTANLLALKSRPDLVNLYKAFLAAAWPEYLDKKR
ncbi:MAG: DUF2520 domain-containing protein [Pseudomonadota bacterium]